MDSQPDKFRSLLHHEIGAAQIRAARSLLDWTRSEAAAHCGVGINTLGKFESKGTAPGKRTMRDIIETFEANGVEFIGRGNSLGVLLRPAGDDGNGVSDA